MALWWNSFSLLIDATPGLFDVSNYRHFILPIVTRIFPVRDAQIRLLLLQYFPYYTPLMEKEVLVQRMLPEVYCFVHQNLPAVEILKLNI